MKVRTSRKKYYSKPLHLRKHDLNVHLSKELRNELNLKKRSVVVKKGDKVRILRGSYKGREGKVVRVSYKTRKIFIEGVTYQNSRGIDKPIPIEPSNALIIELKLDDYRRKKLGIELKPSQEKALTSAQPTKRNEVRSEIKEPREPKKEKQTQKQEKQTQKNQTQKPEAKQSQTTKQATKQQKAKEEKKGEENKERVDKGEKKESKEKGEKS